MGKNHAKSLYGKMPPPAHETEEGKKRLESYYTALGKFVHRFALAELAAHLTLTHYAKLKTSTARALLSGVRIDRISGFISRLHDARLVENKSWENLQPIFHHLSEINKRRNDILHHGAILIAEDDGAVTNATMALTEERITSFEISDKILDDMTSDLRKILLRLHVSHMGRPPLRGKHPEMEDALHGPWRYKLPIKQAKKLQKSTQKEKPSRQARTPPPKSSLT